MILFAVSTLSYTDTRTIGGPFLITIPAFSAASAVAYDPFVCLSTWSKNRPTSGRLLCERTSFTRSGAGSSVSGSLIVRVAIRCFFLLKRETVHCRGVLPLGFGTLGWLIQAANFRSAVAF